MSNTEPAAYSTRTFAYMVVVANTDVEMNERLEQLCAHAYVEIINVSIAVDANAAYIAAAIRLIPDGM